MTLDLADAVGLIGSAIMIVAYAYSNVAQVVDFTWFNLLNLVGAILLLSSLMVHFNLASLLLEVVWSLIAAAGLVKAWRGRARA